MRLLCNQAIFIKKKQKYDTLKDCFVESEVDLAYVG